jgi:hypothetical protein
MPTRFHVAPVGTNPMDQPNLYKKARASRIKIILAVLGCLIIAVLACGVPIYFLARPNMQAAADNKATPTVLISASATGTRTITPTGTPTSTPTSTTTPAQTLATSTTQPPSPTALIETKIVTQIVERVGPVQVRTVVHTRIVEVPRDNPVTVTPGPTMTPQNTQTPWVITVVVIATNTPTSTPTQTPTNTSTRTATIVSTETPTPTQTPTNTLTGTATIVSTETPSPIPMKTISNPTTSTPTPTQEGE